MQIDLAPGKYVVAVSGGVDSVVLLDVLYQLPEMELVIAHFDHGIRWDSVLDRQFVQQLADTYQLPFVFERQELGSQASEAIARQARYAFLRTARESISASQIITAHHQDDLLETAILNMLRGTGRRGLTALANNADITRPLLHVPKSELVSYAEQHCLEWREDSSNADLKYRRNYVRHKIMPKFSQVDRQALINIINKLQQTNQQLDTLLVNYLDEQSNDQGIDRQQFSQLPASVGQELLATWLRQNGIRDFDRKGLKRLVHGVQTKQTGTLLDILHGYSLKIDKQILALRPPER